MGAAAPSPRLDDREKGRAQWAQRNLCFHKQRRVAAAGDAGDNAHLERVVEIRVGKRVTVEIRHLCCAWRHPADPGAERETRRGRRPPARSRRCRRCRRADPGAARRATQPAAPLSMPGATGCRPERCSRSLFVPLGLDPALQALTTTEQGLRAEGAGSGERRDSSYVL